MIVASAVLVWLAIMIGTSIAAAPSMNGDNRPIQRREVSLEGAPIHGNLQARFGVIEYADFECSYCRRFAVEALPAILRDHIKNGDVFLAFKHLPLEAIHPNAFDAAVLAECAARQGKFWNVHDDFFALDSIGPVTPRVVAERHGIDAVAVVACAAADGPEVVRSHIAEARELGIRGTPTFLFGETDGDGRFRVIHREQGVLSSQAFRSALDRTAELALGRPRAYSPGNPAR